MPADAGCAKCNPHQHTSHAIDNSPHTLSAVVVVTLELTDLPNYAIVPRVLQNRSFRLLEAGPSVRRASLSRH